MAEPTTAQIRRFKEAFGTHWVKSSSILSAMPDGLRGHLGDRIEQAPRREQDAIKSLVHFRWTSRKGDSTEETRQQMRTILAGVLARDLPTGAAGTLKTAMRDLPANRLQRVLEGLKDPDVDAAAVLVEALLPHVPDPEAVRQAILQFPVDQARANQLVHDQGDPLLARDDNGRLITVTPENGRRIRAHRISHLPVMNALGNPHQGNLEQCLEALPLLDLGDILSQLLEEPPREPYEALASIALHPSVDDPEGRWDQLRPILLAFPVDLDRAGECVYGRPGLTLERDDQGALQVRSASVRFTGVPIPDDNEPLAPQSIQAIEDLFTQLAPTRYGRHGVPLDFMRYFRTTNQQRHQDEQPPLTLEQALALYQPNGAQLVEHYGRGDCMSLAEKMVADLALLHPPVRALLSGTLNPGLTRQRLPDGGIHDPRDVGVKAHGVTHTNVLVPYTTQDGEERIKVITPGMGLTDRQGQRYCQDMTLEEYLLGQKDLNLTRQDVLGPEGASVNMVQTQKDQLGFLSNIQITNNNFGDGRNVCGIDLLAGKIYLNGAASNAFRGPREDPQQQSVSIDFRDVLAHPDDEVVHQVWDGDLNDGQGGWVQAESTRLDLLVATLTAIGEEFEQPQGFVQNLLTLMANRDGYCDLMWPEVNALRKND